MTLFAEQGFQPCLIGNLFCLTTYYLTDAMGTVIGLANGTGTEVADFRYDSFGNLGLN